MCRLLASALIALLAGSAGGLRRNSKTSQAQANDDELASLADVMSGKISVEQALYPRCDQYTESFPDYSITCGRFLDVPKFNAGNTTYDSGVLGGPGECMDKCNADAKCRGFEYTRNHIYLHGACKFFQVVDEADGVCTHLFPFPLLVYVFTKQGMEGECGAAMPSQLEEKSVEAVTVTDSLAEAVTATDSLAEVGVNESGLGLIELLLLFPNKVCCSSCKYCCNRFLPYLNEQCTSRLTICDVIRNKKQRCGHDCDCR